jgi:hypothetical protein
MKAVVLSLCMLAPFAARADLRLSSPFLEGTSAAARSVAELQLDAGQLTLDRDLAPETLSDRAYLSGGGSSGGANAILAFILGVFPGFGLGHVVADSSRWVTWLVVDLIIALLFWVGFPFFFPRFLWGLPYLLLWILVIIERVFEGLSAARAAGGRYSMAPVEGSPSLASATPERESFRGFTVFRF